ncbi:hypothetical protein D9M68_803780 [compost metagenome]
MIITVDNDVADAAQSARRLPGVAERRGGGDQLGIMHLVWAPIIEADVDRAVAIAVNEALDAIAGSFAARDGLRHQIVLLAVHVDVGLETVAPAVRQRKDVGVHLVAFAPLGIKKPLAARLAGTE